MASENTLLSLRDRPPERSETGRKTAVGNRSGPEDALDQTIPVKLPSENDNGTDNSARCMRVYRGSVLVCRGEAVGLVPARMHLYVGGMPRRFVCVL